MAFGLFNSKKKITTNVTNQTTNVQAAGQTSGENNVTATYGATVDVTNFAAPTENFLDANIRALDRILDSGRANLDAGERLIYDARTDRAQEYKRGMDARAEIARRGSDARAAEYKRGVDTRDKVIDFVKSQGVRTQSINERSFQAQSALLKQTNASDGDKAVKLVQQAGLVIGLLAGLFIFVRKA